METTEDSSICNIPPYDELRGDGDKELYFNTVLDKFVVDYLMPTTNPRELVTDEQPHLVKEYSLCSLRYFFILMDIKDVVREGEGDRLATLHIRLLVRFKIEPGHNAYAI